MVGLRKGIGHPLFSSGNERMARYRWPTVITAATALVLAAFSLWGIFIAYADYRSPDFTKVSAGPIQGTCVEAVSTDQLKTARYDKTDWSCTSDSKTELSNLLAVSVHAMYAANAASAYIGEAKAVYDAVVSATQGVNSGYSITREHAYAALSVVGTPSSTDCAAIYNVSTATEGAEPNPTAPTVVCNAPTPNTNTTVAADVNLLYTHCVYQFSYARSYPDSGTFGIPKVGKEVSPMILPIIATNSTTPWQDRARIVVGTRCARQCTSRRTDIHNTHTHTNRLAHSPLFRPQTRFHVLFAAGDTQPSSTPLPCSRRHSF